MAKKRAVKTVAAETTAWSSVHKDLIQACVQIAGLLGVRVGAYVFLLSSIWALRTDVGDKVEALSQKMTNGFAIINANMSVLIERQTNLESRLKDVKSDVANERKERREDMGRPDRLTTPGQEQ